MSKNPPQKGLSEMREGGLVAAGKRELFAKIQHICQRYGVDLQSATPETLQELLAQDCAELWNVDALASLKACALREDITGRQIVSYRFTRPSIKELNDHYLGENDTNNFMQELHTAIRTLRGLGTPLKTQFKGGAILTSSEYAEDGSELYEQLKNQATEILKRHLAKRVQYLKTLEVDDQTSSNITRVQSLITQIEFGDAGAELCFGIAGPIMPDSDDKTLTQLIIDSEIGANIAKLRKEAEPKGLNQRQNHHRFKLEHLLKDLNRVIGSVREEALEEDGSIKDDWKFFFEFGEDGRTLYMTEAAIEAKRKPEKLKKLAGSIDHGIMAKFSKYYDTINTTDVLKNFRGEKIDAYFQRSTKISELIGRIESALAEKERDMAKLIELLNEASKELELSIKDEGDGICKTFRGYIRAVMEGQKEKIFVFADIIGFGGMNIRGLEKAAHRIVNGEYEELRLAVGDEGTKIIRRKELGVFAGLQGQGQLTLDSSGGDEIRAVICNENPANIEELERMVENLAREYKLRIVAYAGVLELPAIKSPNVSSTERAAIVEIIKQRSDAELADANIKERLLINPGASQIVVEER